jgi:CubicO group peptidase (beta-lactamase class C family)
MKQIHIPFTIFLILILIGCGGGGDGGGNSTVEANAPNPITPINNTLPSNTTWPGYTWDVLENTEDAGMDATKLTQALNYAFLESRNTQGVVVIRHGVIVAERYKEGFDKDSLATSWSAAKSFTSALIGLAIDQGYINSVDDKACIYLTEWDCGELVCQAIGCPLSRGEISIRDILEMRSGLEEKSGVSIYSGADDQLTYSLDRLAYDASGTKFVYSNEDSMILGAVIKTATGLTAKDYAEKELFTQLGMTGDWWTDKENHTMTYCCIDTTSRDFARFGLLFARQGAWNENQIISQEWMDESNKVATGLSNYGLHWWVYPSTGFIGALGLHTNDIWVSKDLDLVVVRNSTYTKIGTDSVRTGSNIHITSGPNSWNNTEFLTYITSSIN